MTSVESPPKVSPSGRGSPQWNLPFHQGSSGAADSSGASGNITVTSTARSVGAGSSNTTTFPSKRPRTVFISHLMLSCLHYTSGGRSELCWRSGGRLGLAASFRLQSVQRDLELLRVECRVHAALRQQLRMAARL